MDEIEKAINVLHNCENSARGTSLSTACHMAISALREQQERQKGCEMCKGVKGEAKYEMGQNYCYNCGRRLKEA